VTALLVALGGGLGAALRFLAGHRWDRDLPAGTLLVNLAGSFLLGLLSALSPGEHALALLGTGFCGGLTTYSAFAVQTHALGRRGAAYAAVTVLAALVAAGLGFWLGQA
jgi:CrcB protein